MKQINNETADNMLKKIADTGKSPEAMNVRLNGESCERHNSKNINITSLKDRKGIKVIVAQGTVDETVSIPVIITDGNIMDRVYNIIEVGDNSDVTIVAGCGIHNNSERTSEHDGNHEITIGKNAKVKYIEKHYGEGNGSGERILNPITKIEVMENAVAELDMTQIEGVDSTKRETNVILHKNAKLLITERLMTSGKQKADSTVDVVMEGEEASAQVISKSVAKGSSVQNFFMNLTARSKSKGHIQCDAIIMDKAKVSSTPKIAAEDARAELIHEATVGRIAGEQLTKLMTIGISEEKAEGILIKGFLE